nr:ABC transporter substrate-binding protein [uncultured Holophaga sp.]
MKHLHLEMSVKQVLQTHPFLIDIFTRHGLGKFADPEVLDSLGGFLKLKTALATVETNRELFLQLLEDRIQEQEAEQDFTLAEHPERQGELTLLALLPCGLRMPYSRALEAFAETYNASHEAPLRYMVEGNVNHELSYQSYLGSVKSVEELPDIIISSDINGFYHEAFRKAFLEPGHFVDLVGKAMHPDLASVGFRDPGGHLTMLSANLLVLVSIDRLAQGLPRPGAWGDLAEPAFANQVVMRGQKEFFCSGVLLPFLAMHGQPGLDGLARSVRSGCHPSEMVKMIDSGSDEVAPFYIMPLFFAKKIKRQKDISIIIPQEGALMSPVQMLVKRSRAAELKEITDFLIGPELGRICADAHFPSSCPGVDNRLEQTPRYWLGWDFLRSRDIGAVKERMKHAFREVFLATGGTA